ncbi:DUF3703 domain-containing protein [Ahniella affigens]|nr:DUF3703 domain-containing protein [Ahniella affigens]
MSMPLALRDAYLAELNAAESDWFAGQHQSSFAHLERAHILSQKHTLAHTYVHWQMLRFGWAKRDWREILGQLLRLPAALTKSRFWVPMGNTGGANVSAIKPMPVPEDLRAILGDAQP